MYLRPIAKGFVPAVSLLLVAAILCSCGRSRDKAGVHEIEFMNWETSPEGMQLYGKLIKEFEKENPNVRVKNIIVASAYATKLLTRFGGGTPPDIFEIQAEIIHPFLRKNLLLNLSQPIRKSKELNEEDFFPASLVNFRYDGKNFRTGDVYVLPKDMGSTTLVYNKDLFDKAGIPYPDANWSEKEYVEAAAKLTKRGASNRVLQIGIAQVHYPLDIMLNKGSRLWSDDYKRCLLGCKAAIETFQLIYDLQEIHKVALTQNELHEMSQREVGFVSGKAGMSTIQRYMIPDMIRDIGDRFRWAVAPMPKFNGSRKQYMYGPSGWAISRSTRYPEDCLKFMEFLAGRRGQIETAKAGWNIPSNKKVAYTDVFLKNLNRPDSEEINRVFLKALDDADLTLLNPYMPMDRVQTLIADNFHPSVVKRNNGRVDALLKKTAEMINKEIEEAVRKYGS